MELGSLVFIRMNLHKPGRPSIHRGEQGTMVSHDGTQAVVQLAIGKQKILLNCLEPRPGTFSKGLAALTRSENGIYSTGMMCSDIEFPRRGEEQYKRYWEHLSAIADTGCGASFYEGIDALNIIGSFHRRYPEGATNYLKKIGLIVCEHIWPWGRGSRTQFLLSVVRSLESQMTSIPKIILLRRTDVDPMRHELAQHRRIVMLDGSDVKHHYTPLRMDWTAPSINPIIAAETAIYIKPIEAAWHIVRRPLHIPTEVLLHMFQGKKHCFWQLEHWIHQRLAPSTC